jgi:hypothetical protein
MKKTLTLSLLFFIYYFTVHAQAVYVDSNIGNDNNTGTEKAPVFSINKAAEIILSKDNDIYSIKINPGIYILDKRITVATEKAMTDKRIVIEASILPDDSTWTPEKMPVIISRSKTGEIMAQDNFLKDNWITSFYINESHVTIKGLKFLGSNYPAKVFYPISRFNKTKSDLLVEQCIFLGDLQTSSIQAGIIAHGDSVKVDHCIFYNTNNAVVYWQDSGNGIKTGNSMTYCIVYGTSESAIWAYSPDNNFVYKNNIVSNCKIFWSTNTLINNAKYTVDNCVIVNNKIFTGDGEKPLTFALNETNVIKEGTISLRLINSVFEPMPIDHLHIVPNTLGYNLGAGLFKHIRQ